MSKYQKYGKELDELMRKRFSDYEKIDSAYRDAKKAHSEYPLRTGWGVTQDYYIKALKAEAAFKETEQEFKKAEATYKGIVKEAQAIRDALHAEMQSDFSVNPADLDRNVVDLLASGICTAQEIERLYTNAQNNTTKRYIAQYAKKLDRDGMSREDVRILNNVAADGQGLLDPNLTETMHKFDICMDVVKRCANNTGMIKHWGQLTEQPLAEM